MTRESQNMPNLLVHLAVKLSNKGSQVVMPLQQVSSNISIRFYILTCTTKGVLIRHARDCFGSDAVESVQQSKDINKAREVLKKFGKKSQSKLTAALKTIKGWAESFSTQPPSKESIRSVFFTPTSSVLQVNNAAESLLLVGCLSRRGHSTSSKTVATVGCRRRDVPSVIFPVAKRFRRM